MAKISAAMKAVKKIGAVAKTKPKKPSKEQQRQAAERARDKVKARKEKMRGILKEFENRRPAKKPQAAAGGSGRGRPPIDKKKILENKKAVDKKQKLEKQPTTIREANEKARHHHAATVKALTRQQAVIRREAKAAGMSVKAYKEKFSNRASVKKLKELQKQNEAVRNKQFKKGGMVRKK